MMNPKDSWAAPPGTIWIPPEWDDIDLLNHSFGRNSAPLTVFNNEL
jgi:hypothetical protein